ncbi:hypothetical protein NM688_g9026 [Phlebia brevispora]|uniref:Uncharacterized protein n=1 Tax=Phlebia brevispora TaxID=194682 RepID=A0ACC1RMX2_9APHY|nr:hypothetical protein NM688_g9026 [Phlebia brevispora]
MAFSGWSIATLALALVGVRILLSLIRSYRLERSMPPGPRGLPFIGNALQLSTKLQFLQFDKWAERFGPIYSLNVLGQRIVVLNSFKHAANLFEHRSNIYSDRPRLIMPERFTGGYLLATMPFGELWRKMRRATHEAFNPRAVEAYRSVQEKHAASLGLKLIHDPQNWDSHIMHSVGASMVTIIYGPQKNVAARDAMVDCINDFVRRLSRASAPGEYLVEAFPFLVHLPDFLAPWKRESREWYKADTAMFVQYLNDIEESLKQGDVTREWSFGAYLVQDADKLGLSKVESAWLTGMIFGAGVDTSAAMVMAFVLAMVLNPDVMKQGQAVVDAAVGRDRMPTAADVDQLPYIIALVKETLRWRVSAPIGVPHRCIEDNWYNGYFIPKDTLVIGNSWGMNRDPVLFPDYDAFRPERFLDVDGQLTDLIPDTHGLGHLSFGAGKRICPGKDLATQSLFINFAVMLWAFDFAQETDEAGCPVAPSSMEFIDNVITVRPARFKCLIRPRFPEVEHILAAAAHDF